jgi:hypothetical protein
MVALDPTLHRTGHGGSVGKGWYPPQGEYKDVFAVAPLRLDDFS